MYKQGYGRKGRGEKKRDEINFEMVSLFITVLIRFS